MFQAWPLSLPFDLLTSTQVVSKYPVLGKQKQWGWSGSVSEAFPCGVQGRMSSHKVAEVSPQCAVSMAASLLALGCEGCGGWEPRPQVPLLGSSLLSTSVFDSIHRVELGPEPGPGSSSRL